MPEIVVTPEFAGELADMRLLQTERLLEWLLENVGVAGAEAISCALGAVVDARIALTGFDRGDLRLGAGPEGLSA